VVAAGRLTPQRRPKACAEILAGVADLAEVAWIGGGGASGRERSAAQAALTAAGAPPTGWLTREAVMEELRRATVYLHWTAGDGQALSLLEAMASDAVIVASDIAPNRDVVDRRQLCANESEAIAMIRRIVTEPAYAEELLALQRRRRPGHSASSMGQAWLELYARLAKTDVEAAGPQRPREPAPYE
jgi:glycosyltransferase involved in cell wall biosynthesis